MLSLRPYQTEAIAAVLEAEQRDIRRPLIALPTGCHASGQGILMYDGSVKRVEEIEVGDALMGPDSLPRYVVQLCRGEDEIVEVRPKKGKAWYVNRDHILTLVKTAQKPFLPYPSMQGGTITDVPISSWEHWSWTAKHIHKLFRTSVTFPPLPAPLPLDPYFLGVLLGDGTLAQPLVSVCKPDTEIEETCQAVAAEYGLRVRAEYGPGRAPQFHLVGVQGAPNPIRAVLRSFGLSGVASEKRFIPHPYKVASREDRLSLLAGLIDTDGSPTCGGYDFISKSPMLSQDVAFVARSLGLAAYVTPAEKWCQTGAGGVYWRVSISGDCSLIPCHIPRKRVAPRQQKKSVLRTGFKIIPTGARAPYYGFTLTGDGRYLLDDFTVTHNTGKTVVFAHLLAQRTGRSLILVHRDELIQQAYAKLKEIDPARSIGIIKAERDEHDAPTVIASVQTLAREARLRRLTPDFRTIVIDECFPAGTMVDGRPIETIRRGDYVKSFNHSTGKIERRRVLRLFVSRPHALVTVHLANGRKIACTFGHPFFTADGYIPAGLLRPGCRLFTYPEMSSDETTNYGAVYGMHSPSGDYQQSPQGRISQVGQDILHDELPGYLGQSGQLRSHGRDEQEIRLTPYEGTQPYAQRGEQEENGRDAQSYWAYAEEAGRQWQGANSTPITSLSGLTARVGSGVCRQDTYEAGLGLSLALQTRPCLSVAHAQCGNRRVQPHLVRAESPGQEEGGLSEGPRVVRVEVHKPTSDGGFGNLCPDGLVYNLEVEGNHNYFADGVLVHNCHHAVADSYRRILAHCGAFSGTGPLTLGVTATPTRGDDVGLDAVFQEIVYQKTIREMILAGYLADLRALRIGIKADFHNLHTRMGDFLDSELEDMLLECDAPGQIAEAYQQHARGRKALLFTPTVRVARLMAAAFQHVDIAAESVDGTTPIDERRAILKRFKHGETQILANCGVLTEGFDEPSVDCVIIARPTKSATLYTQMVGRGTRIYPGKQDCLVMDLVGVTRRHDLQTIASLTGLPRDALKNGTSVAEVIIQQEELQQREVRHGEIVAKAVELFRSRPLHWLAAGRSFVLSLGDHGWLLLSADAEGEESWNAFVVRPDGDSRQLAEGLSLAYAQGVAEDFAREVGAGALVNPKAQWRQKPLREYPKMQYVLRKFHIPPRPDMTAGEAADLIAVAKLSQVHRMDPHRPAA